MSKASFSKARKELSHTAFIELRQRTNHLYYQDFPAQKHWRGHRLLAVDGSKLTLPDEAAVREHFGVPGESQAPMALLSGLYDVLNGRWIDAQLRPYASSERDCVVEHLWHTEDHDLVLYDRGYPGYWLYALHHERKRHFCMRVAWNLYNEGRDLCRDPDRREAIITLKPSKEAKAKCAEVGIASPPLRLRLIKVQLDGAQGKGTELLITDLLDEQAYPADDFKALYHHRWAIEEGYKALKCRAEVENWSGRSVEAIEQDVHIKLLTQNLNAMHVAAAELRREERQAKRQRQRARRHEQAINRAAALTRLKDQIVGLLSGKGIKEQVRALIERISELTEVVRPGRRIERKRRSTGRSPYRRGYKPMR